MNEPKEAAPDSLSSFHLAEVLDDRADQKFVTLLGRSPRMVIWLDDAKINAIELSSAMLSRCSFEGKPGQAIVSLARRHFDRQALQPLLHGLSFVEEQFRNDIYSKAWRLCLTTASSINAHQPRGQQ